MDPASLEQALAGLRDIHSPPPPGVWPLALGWWLLIALAILLPIIIVFVVKKIKTRRVRLRVRKLALAEFENLNTLWSEQAEPKIALPQLALLLRRAAIAKFGQQHVSPLSGKAWKDFLQLKAPDLQWGEQADWLLDQRFSGAEPDDDDARYCFALSKQWLVAAL
ncbi:MAG: hypothetical protein ACI91G_000764 [Gammaproteobacteria bacterium]|jgi:hypothetical protein